MKAPSLFAQAKLLSVNCKRFVMDKSAKCRSIYRHIACAEMPADSKCIEGRSHELNTATNITKSRIIIYKFKPEEVAEILHGVY